MAYNLQPLIQILDQTLHPDHNQSWILDHIKPQIGCLLEKASRLKDFLENFSLVMGSKRIESLESQIRDAAHKAEDIIESHVASQILGSHMEESSKIYTLDLQKVVQEFDSAKEELMKIMDGNQSLKDSSLLADSSSSEPNFRNIVVGFGENLIQLKEQITGQESKLEIVPIVGMGGIGKTTLARTVYDDPLIISHFDTCVWITMSQEYNLRGIFLHIIKSLGKLNDEMLQKILEDSNDQLAVDIYKSLNDRRYLVVIDDLWSSKAWDDVKMLFPNCGNRSRIMLTTRELDVANYVSSKDMHHQMHFLDKDDSWNLLREMVFGRENCPLEFEKLGKHIAKNCGGLPLAIQVISELLSKAKRARDVWEMVSNNVSSIVTDKHEHFSKILSLSYNHLPHHLRPCFLYMGAFPQDYEIRVSKLIRLWVAEGFLKPIGDKSSEEAGEKYLKALVDRNLILLRQLGSNGKIKSCGIHDLLRDLCVRKAREENFIHIKNRQVHTLPTETLRMRRVSTHPSYYIRDIYDSLKLMSLARSFLCIGPASQVVLSPVLFDLKLLRILDVYEIEFHAFPKEILQLINLRYLAFTCHSDLRHSISRLWNLQTLVVRRTSYYRSENVPSEIWEMPHLRHVKFKETFVYFDPKYRESLDLEKLQSLSTIVMIGVSYSRFFERTPNLKKLGICCDLSEAIDLARLQKLETLKCLPTCLGTRKFSFKLTFPASLRKLTLYGCPIPHKFMATVGSLPNLEVLKLRRSTFEGQELEPTELEWEPVEGEFSQLLFLLLEKLNLVHWRSDETHFPRLRRLIIRDCPSLKEIPGGIGFIPTLEMIELDDSSPSAVSSAKDIQEEQEDFGNNGLQVRFYGTSLRKQRTTVLCYMFFNNRHYFIRECHIIWKDY